MTRIAFHGGAGTVTGSKTLIEHDGDLLLVDCGMFQGVKALREMNWQRPGFEPRDVGAVALTHAHIDHTGYLPRLVRDGFRGAVFATPATADLADILLHDSAEIQEEDAEYANRKGFSKHKPALPLYGVRDVDRTMRYVRPVHMDKWVETGKAIRLRFREAGHILGSSFVEVETGGGVSPARLVFSGDLGRFQAPLHPDPARLPACDALILESTYGNRQHDHRSIIEQMAEAFTPVLRRGGIILIPSFAVARAQVVTYYLREAFATGSLPEVPIHIDSPMASDVTKLYGRHIETRYLDAGIPGSREGSLFPRSVRFHQTVWQSKELNNVEGPRIIIAASGMMTGGRILHHVKRLATDPKNMLAFVGYQAEGTRGRDLIEGKRTIRIHGRPVDVRCQVTSLNGLSAHADADELVRWVREAEAPPKHVYLNHGEPDAAAALSQRLRTELGLEVTTAALGDSFTIP